MLAIKINMILVCGMILFGVSVWAEEGARQEMPSLSGSLSTDVSEEDLKPAPRYERDAPVLAPSYEDISSEPGPGVKFPLSFPGLRDTD